MGLWFGLFGVPYLLTRLRGNGMRRDLGLEVRWWPDLPLGGFWGFVGQFGILAIVYLPMQWFTDVTQEELSEPARDMADKATGALGVVLLVLIVGVGAPIVEEIFYRGLVQGSLVRRLGPVWGIGIASAIFGLVHFQLLQLPALALAGVLFGVLAYRSGRLGPAIVAHVVFNMTAVVVLLSES
jgi:membrane protease YdiL (CAAX protease family)